MEYHVSYVVAYVEVVELVSVEAEVLFKTANVGIANVRLVYMGIS